MERHQREMKNHESLSTMVETTNVFFVKLVTSMTECQSNKIIGT